MIRRFYVRNFAIIDETEIEFEKGLNVITGETGAGKSIIIGALEFLLGGRYKDWMAMNKDKEMVVEGEFILSSELFSFLKSKGIEIEEAQISLRRKTSQKRVSGYINGLSANLSLIGTVGEVLVDIHGQHEHQFLLKEDNQREVLDVFCNNQNLLKKLSEKLKDLNEKERRIEELRKEIERIEKEKEFYEYQLKEIKDASLRPGEYEELKKQRELLATAEKRYEISSAIIALLSEREGSLVENIAKLKQFFSQLCEKDPEMKKNFEKLSYIEAEIDEIWREMTDYKDRIDFSEEKLDEIESRLFLLERLMKKYNRDEKSILEYAEELERRLSSVEVNRDEIKMLGEEIEKAKKEVNEIAEKISENRRKKAAELVMNVKKELSLLGLSNAVFEIEFEEKEIDEKGKERVRFIFSANPGIKPKPLSFVISGGELSRIMLAIKSVLSYRDMVSVLIFDEIDVGIGGKTADIVGRKLKEISKHKQVIVITHLPQIARFADTHFRVTKTTDGKTTVTRIEKLNEKERVKEIARMLGGEKITPTTISHAKELLERK